jgi:hypothetical protein
MKSDKRKAKRVSVEFPVTVYLFDNRENTRRGVPLEGRISDFSPLGARLTIPTMTVDGKHLFYACNGNPDYALDLAFALEGSTERVISVPATPVWFDRDLASEREGFIVGLKFLADSKSPEIRILCQEACQDEQRFLSLWRRFFQ